MFGLAKSGVAAVRLLLAHGAQVTALDARDEAALGEVARELKSQGVTLVTGSTPRGLLEAQNLVVVSPGVPLSLPELKAARAAGIPIWGEMELAWRFLPRDARSSASPAPTARAPPRRSPASCSAEAGGRTFVGGNLGRAAGRGGARRRRTGTRWWWSCPASSSRASSRCGPTGAAILNLTPDHLDRYASHETYGAAKARIFLNQPEGDFAVVNAEDAHVMRLARQAKVPVYGFSLTGALAEGGPQLAGLAVAQKGGFRLDFLGEDYTLTNRALRGAHNAQNAMAAALLARLGGVPREAVQAGLDGYPGLPHRMESVRVLDGVEWVNDSKATNVDSVLVALRAFPGNLLLIAGGKGKGAPYQPMVDEGRGKVTARAHHRPGRGHPRRRLPGRGAGAPVRHAGGGREEGTRAGEEWGHRAAVSGLRVVRSVQELRGPGRHVQAPRAGALRTGP